MNLIFICTELKRLYNVVLGELLYNSVVEGISFSESTTDGTTSDGTTSEGSSEDDVYMELLKRKNEIQSVVFMKNSLCFIIIDISDNCYGIYYPGSINSELNHCINSSIFSLAKGIEVNVKKYYPLDAFAYIRFSNDDYLMEFGSKNWLLRLYNDRIEFNNDQKVLSCYNRTIMKSSKIKQILIFNCK